MRTTPSIEEYKSLFHLRGVTKNDFVFIPHRDGMINQIEIRHGRRKILAYYGQGDNPEYYDDIYFPIGNLFLTKEEYNQIFEC